MVALQGGHHVRHRTLSVHAGPAVAVDGEPRGHVGQAPGGCSVSVPARRLNHEARFIGFQGEDIHVPGSAESSQTGSIAPRPLLDSRGYEDALAIVGSDLSCAVGFPLFQCPFPDSSGGAYAAHGGRWPGCTYGLPLMP